MKSVPAVDQNDIINTPGSADWRVAMNTVKHHITGGGSDNEIRYAKPVDDPHQAIKRMLKLRVKGVSECIGMGYLRSLHKPKPGGSSTGSWKEATP
ncbi:hypothetical protein [Grimontia marina]|uniref:hypothetical protein n=1 Tax=Grimontia marina TaxID=646534 RepID=UPI00078799C9|nr:hypothetical protein [Grimontia marina]